MSSTGHPQEPSAEFEKPFSTLDALRARRHELAEQKAIDTLRAAIPDAITSPDTAFTKVSASSVVENDIGKVSWNDYLVLDGLGQSFQEVTGLLRAPSGDATALHISKGAEHINIRKLGQGITFTFSVDGAEDTFPNGLSEVKSQEIRAQIIDRYRRSPAHQALHALAESSRAMNDATETLTTDWFDPEEDLLGTISALSSVGLIDVHSSSNYETLPSIKEVLKSNDLLDVDQQAGEDGQETIFSNVDTDQGLVRTVYFDNTGRMAISMATDPQYWYAERANSSSNIEGTPFLETQCAADFLGALDKVGLMPHPTYQNEMIRLGNANRYGGVYTQMSREIAKWIDRDERRDVSNLFVPYDSRTHAKGMRPYGGFESDVAQLELDSEMTYEERTARQMTVEERILSINESTMSEPAKLLFRLTKQSITRDANDDLPELPLTQSDVQIKSGACFDVATYYFDAAGLPDGLRAIRVGDIPLLEKLNGAHTFLLQVPTVLNGVELPKGTLMSRGGDGGWAMQRLTLFCFDDKQDQLALGSEVAKAYQGQTGTIRRIGGATLASLIEAAR